MKSKSTFYPAEIIERPRALWPNNTWAQAVLQETVSACEPWMAMSYDELWQLMFGPTITRSWMVLSDGCCPSCRQPVPMYEWKMDALRRPWKTWCPYCSSEFPTNDFAAYYRSGLDAGGVFDPTQADRSLLFNPDHPDPDDPLHLFGVDDGEGYLDEGRRWRFIGAYLIYGQWKQAVVSGVQALAHCYVLTRNSDAARRAAVLLDRIADLYPDFDFGSQGRVYEEHHVKGRRGYVSTWHDACEEIRELALAYDMIVPALQQDPTLVTFLSEKAAECGLANPKTSPERIQQNIANRLLRDTLAHREKIASNYPRTDIAIAVIKAVLDWPENQQEVYALIDDVIANSTKVDGVTGEKGLSGYSTIGPGSLAVFLATWERAIPGFLARCLRCHPQLYAAYRFHIDTWCLEKYYPNVGDAGGFALPVEQYRGLPLTSTSFHPVSAPSMYTFLWQLYRLTNDPVFAQTAYRANRNSVTGLPYDLFCPDPAAVCRDITAAVEEHGKHLELQSTNKPDWNLAILRSGRCESARAAWLHYGVGGNHRHQDGMNLGLYAYGLDLLPDFGYPPVQYGGWGSPEAVWYKMSAAHNTVAVDGRDHQQNAGASTLWLDQAPLKAVRASAAGVLPASPARFERTVILVDLPEPEAFYIVDIFRVRGGRDHAYFLHSHFSQLTASGLSLTPGADYGYGTKMRSFYWDSAPQPGWSTLWRVEDRLGLQQNNSPVYLRYTGLMDDAAVGICEGWISTGSAGEAWLPRLVIRRQSEQEPLVSTFVGLIEPFREQSSVVAVRRPAVVPGKEKNYGPEPSHVAVEVTHRDGTRDVVLAADVEQQGGMEVADDEGIGLDGELALVRRNTRGCRVTAGQTRSIRLGGQTKRNVSPDQPMCID